MANDTINFTKQFIPDAKKIIDKHQIPGFSIAINKNGKHFYEKGFGYRDADTKHEMTSDTVCGIASITKSFTCVAIMKLQEQQKLTVNDSISKYLPEFKTPNEKTTREITLHHLMTHTAGLPPLPTGLLTMKDSLEKDPSTKDYPGLDLLSAQGEALSTYEQFIKHISQAEYKLLGKPGENFSYSNDSYTLLGAIIERVSGQSFYDFLNKHVLEPAGMAHTVLAIEQLNQLEHVTTLFATKRTGEVYPAPQWWESSVHGAGGLKSTTNDLLRFSQLILNDGVVDDAKILTNESIKAMIHPHVKVEPGTYYGYGFMIMPDFHGKTLIEHGGSSKGVASLLSMVLEDKISIAALTNLAGVPTDEVVRGALNVLYGLPFANQQEKMTPVEISVEKLTDYTGSYTSEEGVTIKVSVENDQLYLYSNNQRELLTYIGNDMFAGIVKSSEEIIQFLRDENAIIDRISYHFRQIFKDSK